MNQEIFLEIRKVCRHHPTATYNCRNNEYCGSTYSKTLTEECSLRGLADIRPGLKQLSKQKPCHKEWGKCPMYKQERQTKV